MVGNIFSEKHTKFKGEKNVVIKVVKTIFPLLWYVEMQSIKPIMLTILAFFVTSTASTSAGCPVHNWHVVSRGKNLFGYSIFILDVITSFGSASGIFFLFENVLHIYLHTSGVQKTTRIWAWCCGHLWLEEVSLGLEKMPHWYVYVWTRCQWLCAGTMPGVPLGVIIDDYPPNLPKIMNVRLVDRQAYVWWRPTKVHRHTKRNMHCISSLFSLHTISCLCLSKKFECHQIPQSIFSEKCLCSSLLTVVYRANVGAQL